MNFFFFDIFLNLRKLFIIKPHVKVSKHRECYFPFVFVWLPIKDDSKFCNYFVYEIGKSTINHPSHPIITRQTHLDKTEATAMQSVITETN